MRVVRFLVAAGLLVGACGGDDREGAATTTTDTRHASLEVQDGEAVVEAGGERFEFIVHECLVGEAETGSPVRRLALSASTTEPFLEADVVLNVDILVSQTIADHEQHTIEITRFDDVDLAANDVRKPGGGGLAPDDWIEIGDGVVTGSGFELKSPDLDDDAVLADGRLVADCDSAVADGE